MSENDLEQTIKWDFFVRNSYEVGRDLIGAELSNNNKLGIITETGSFEGHLNNRRVKGLEYDAGEIYLFASSGKYTLAINTREPGIASVITIRELQTEDKILKPSEIARYFELTKKDNEALFYERGLSIKLNPTESYFISNAEAHEKRIKIADNCLGYHKLKG